MSNPNDLTMKQYRAAAVQEQFEPQMGGMFLRDTSTPSGVLYGCVTEGGVISYRASLASAIMQRAESRALGQKVIALAAEGKSEIEIVAITGKTLPQVITTRRMEEERAARAREQP
jgi:hypothetical protein